MTGPNSAQTLTVNGTGFAAGVTLVIGTTRIASTLTPSITSLTPSTITHSNASQTITINGTGFYAGLKVLLTSTGAQQQTATIVSSTATQIQATVSAATARVWSVQVVNAALRPAAPRLP